jgi:N-acyl-D-amino-acid deacylase
LVILTILFGCHGSAKKQQAQQPMASAQPAAPQAAPSARPTYTLVLRNGRVIDGAGNAWFYGDVALKGDRIAFVGTLKPDSYTADRELDVHGLVIAPGFIDVHSHADDDLYKMPQAENFIRDGVTTLVCGNCGGSMKDVGEYFARLQQKGVGIDVATLIGHNTVLRAVKGDVRGDLTPEQMTKAKAIVDQAMRDGAVGFSTGLIYIPGQWSKTEEIIELQKVAAGYGGIYATHMRSESTEIVAAIDEALRVGREANCRVEISHFKLASDVSKRMGGTADAALGSDVTLRKVTSARVAGQEVWLDQYPYTASSTTISTLLPDWVLEKGRDEAKRTLTDPAGLKRVLDDMRQQNEVQRHRKTFRYVVIGACKEYPQYNGKDMYTVAMLMKQQKAAAGGKQAELLGSSSSDASTQPSVTDVTMEDQYRAIIDIVLHGGASCVFHSMAEEDVENIMRSPLVSIASDSGVRAFGVAQPHPRGYGTNARVLGHYARERRTIPLEDAVRKMTSLPATAFRFNDRGLLREGYVADITVFDPATVSDKATFEQPHQYSVGIVHVLVNGEFVLRDAKMTGALPGKPVYGPGKTR